MNRKIKGSLLALTCAALLLCTGCSSAETSSAEATATPAPTATAEPTATPAPELDVIGEKSESEETFKVTLENGTEQDITAVSVKTGDEEKFPENMMAKDDVFEKGEKSVLYYTPKKDDASSSSASSDDKIVTPRYDIQITLKDGTQYVLHAFPFGDIEEGKIQTADDVAYLTYTSVKTKEKVDTKEAELAEKETENSEVSVQTEETPASEPTYEEPSYEEPSYEEPSYEEPSYEEPAYTPEEPDNGGQEGCVNGALFN